jgi:beta-glucosidase
MTLEQKIGQLHGQPSASDFRRVPGIPELCVPDLTVTNGPAGVGPSITPDRGVPATAMPAPVTLAATWDPRLAGAFGDTVGAEMRETGRNLLEAPDVDLARVPLNGRTFEAFGEDPYLASRIAVPEIRAVQRRGVIAMVKHYVANNQEQYRSSVDTIVSERALHELYLVPFEAAVREARVASAMCAYNKVNGAYNCENVPLLRAVLRSEWGFDGFVQSDFGATHSTERSVRAGMDLEMPAGAYYGDALRAAVRDGRVPEKAVDRMLEHRYSQMFRLGIFDRPVTTAPIPVEQHAAVARRIAAAGTVLLRNEDGILPLHREAVASIAVVGSWATIAATGGGGSSKVTPIRTVSPVDGIRARAGSDVPIVTPADPSPAAAAAVAASADVAVVVAGEYLTEGTDRTGLALPDGQDALIEAVAAANPRTVVVVHAGAPITMPWLDRVPGVVSGWYPGQEDGTVTAAILFGDAEPSGRLPLTFPRSLADTPAATPDRYPGVGGTVRYEEELAVGYRSAPGTGTTPLFPFGFGLSYTTFRVSGLRVPSRVSRREQVVVRARVTNTGRRPGREVVQVYVRAPASVAAPSSELRGFAKARIEPGGTQQVRIALDPRSFSHWDSGRDRWVVTPGTYTVLVGTSALDTPMRASVRVGGR